MNILAELSGATPVLIQGASGRMGRSHTRLMRAYGTNIVAGTVAAGAVILGQAIERDEQHVIGQRGNRGVLVAVVQHLVVDLVGKHHQLMLAGQFDDLQQQFIRVQRAGRIIGIDDDDGAGVGVDLLADVVDIRQPARLLVTDIVHRLAAGKTDRRRPQGIVGRRHQYFVAGIEQGLHAHHDQLGSAVAEVDIVDGDAVDVLFLGVLHHRLARREQPLGIGIARGVAEVADHVLDDFLGRFKAKHGEVADVELDDFVTVLLHLPGLVEHGPTNVVADVGKLVGFLDGSHGESFGLGALARRRARQRWLRPCGCCIAISRPLCRMRTV